MGSKYPERKKVGAVTRYVDVLETAFVFLEGKLEVGDMISIEGPDTDLRQNARMMRTKESDLVPVNKAGTRELVGLEVEKPVHGGDDVYLLRSVRKKLSGKR